MFLEKFKYINIDTNLFNKICDNLNTITPDNILCDNNHRDKNNYVLILIENNVLDFIIKHDIKLYYTYDRGVSELRIRIRIRGYPHEF